MIKRVSRYTLSHPAPPLFLFCSPSLFSEVPRNLTTTPWMLSMMILLGGIGLGSLLFVILLNRVIHRIRRELAVEARRCARSHMLFNIFGVIWMFFLLNPMIVLLDILVPGTLSEPPGTTFHLAAFHSLFNIVNTLLLAGFIPQIRKLVIRLIPDRKTYLPEGGAIAWISGNLLKARDANLIIAGGAVLKLSREVRIMAD